MKTILSGVIISLFISCSVQGQNFWEWSDPVPLTDSLSDNTNPVLYTTWQLMGEALFMFWEKSTDTTSTEIWMDNILDAEMPQVVLSEPGIHFTNPQVMSAWYYPYPDSLFYLFYETNQNGNIDIYYKLYRPDGSFTAPEPFATSPSDDVQLSVGGGFYYDESIIKLNAAAWINNGQLFARLLAKDNGQYFTDPVIVDSGQCCKPIVSGGDYSESIAYLREDTSGKHIYQSFADNDGIWSIPEVYYDSTVCENQTRGVFYYDLCWSTYIDTSWRIMIKNWNSYNLYNISSTTPFDPAVLRFVIGVKSSYPEVWIAITYPENDVDEIFMTGGFGTSNFENFSNSGTMNKNPQFYHGEAYNYCWYDYLVWESYGNGHWQIWTSKVLQCAGSVDENETNESVISIHPNPFTHKTTLEFTLDNRSEVLIEVYDNRGMQVATIANQSFDQGGHQLRWDGSGLTAGVYVIKMTVGDMIYTTKVVKSP